MKKWFPVWPLLALAVAVLVWNYPAYALADRIAAASQGRIQVLNSHGSVWSGHMQLGISDGSRLYAIGEPMKWRLALLKHNHWLGVELQHPKLLQDVHLGVNAGGISVSGGELRVPAAWLGGLGAPFNTIRPEGLLHMRWQPWLSGQDMNVQIQWQDAQSALASIRPLGEYVISVTGNPDTKVSLTLETRKGPLQLDGLGQWSHGQRFVFNGYASSDERSKEALTGLLSQMGRREGERYRLGVF
ncbi:MAG TPA: type II secretion system protein N [Limnobacter sp.]|nr:type II secretion system protein N [Limnobacter sp.]